MTPSEILKQYFGYDEFREGQVEIIDAVMRGRDVLGIMPTGAGKSLCYQVPAMLLPGAALIVSPLISLMRDQVQALKANGIPAAYINSSLTVSQVRQVTANARDGRYKIIYIAPERLLTPSMTELAAAMRISFIAVDESHCISQWGQDFRPSYLDISGFIGLLPVRPVLGAFTATATPRVREDILEKLKLKDPLTLVTGFDRPNLYFAVSRPKDKYSALAEYLHGKDGSGIVYCSTRKETESVAERLAGDGYPAACYHAGLGDAERSRSQDDFLYGRVKIIAATNAFGMGIDKSDVRFVIHYNMPQNVESYYQEAGRAGRDGLPADCILFYARRDVNSALFLIRQSNNPDEVVRNRKLLDHMERYCETDGCLRRYILGYFGEKTEEDCGNCENCRGSYDETDVTTDAKKILSHITRLNRAGKRLRFTHTADILLGRSDDFTDLPTFGIMKGAPRRYIRRLTSRLTVLGYIDDDGFLSVTPKADGVLFGGETVTVRGNKPDKAVKAARRNKHAGEPEYVFSDGILGELRELRLDVAGEENVPPFIVFSDATLVDMCLKLPRTADELLAVSGVGKVKLERYGDRFLQLLRRTERDSATKEKPPELTEELFMRQIEFSGDPLQISLVADHINAMLIRYGKPKTGGAKLNDMLVRAGYLEITDGVKAPADSGEAIGITVIRRSSSRGTYLQCLFGINAQRICAEMAFREIGQE